MAGSGSVIVLVSVLVFFSRAGEQASRGVERERETERDRERQRETRDLPGPPHVLHLLVSINPLRLYSRHCSDCNEACFSLSRPAISPLRFLIAALSSTSHLRSQHVSDGRHCPPGDDALPIRGFSVSRLSSDPTVTELLVEGKQ